MATPSTIRTLHIYICAVNRKSNAILRVEYWDGASPPWRGRTTWEVPLLCVRTRSLYFHFTWRRCAITAAEMRPILSYCTGEYEPEEPMEKNAALAMICRPTFVIYWYNLNQKIINEAKSDASSVASVAASLATPYPYYDLDIP